MENQNVGASLSGGQKVASKKGGKKNIKPIIALIVLGVIVAVVIVVVLVLLPKKGQSGDTEGDNQTVATPELTSEEEQKVTEETLKNTVEVNIEGYEKVDDNEVSSDIVKVAIKNISDKTASIEVVIGAYDKDGNLLETSALYAEAAEPGVTQEFQLFPYTNLTVEQLQNSTYKVYKARTYEPTPVVDVDNGETVEETEE